MIIIFSFLIAHWFLSLFCQTFFLHRYASHGMFRMSPFWEKAFYLLTYVTQGSSYLNPRAYAFLHRSHHQYSDSEKDPHSPHQSRTVVGMMKKTYTTYHQILKNPPADTLPKDYPEWKLIDNLGDWWVSRIGWGAAYTAFYYFFAPTPWLYLLLPVHYFMGPIHGAVVNWCGHKYGYANFDNKDHSKNVFPFEFLMLGELFQNNHHKFAKRVNFACRKFEFDPTYVAIWVMSKLRILKLA